MLLNMINNIIHCDSCELNHRGVFIIAYVSSGSKAYKIIRANGITEAETLAVLFAFEHCVINSPADEYKSIEETLNRIEDKLSNIDNTEDLLNSYLIITDSKSSEEFLNKVLNINLQWKPRSNNMCNIFLRSVKSICKNKAKK